MTARGPAPVERARQRRSTASAAIRSTTSATSRPSCRASTAPASGRAAGCARACVSRSSRIACSASTVAGSAPSSAARRRARSAGSAVRNTFSSALGRDDRADVATLGDPVAAGDQLALLGHERLAHARVGGHPRGGLGDLRRADRLADVASVEQDRGSRPARSRARARELGRLRAGLGERQQRHAAIHRAAVQVGEPERARRAPARPSTCRPPRDRRSLRASSQTSACGRAVRVPTNPG